MTIACLRAVTRFLRRVAERDAHARTDQELLDRFTRYSDEAAFADLVRRHGPMVLGVCRRVLSHEQDAEDVFQAAFLVLVRKATSIRRQESVGGWLYRVAYRLALRVRAGRGRERPTDPLDLCGAAEARPAPDLLPCALDEEVQRLPEPYRSAAVLCYLEGRTQAEAARLLVTTADAVNSRLKRARDLLRRRLGQRGLLLWAAPAAGSGGGTASLHAAVSPDLVRLTARAAMDFAANPAATGAASALAITLTRGALPTMLTTRFKLASLLLLVLALLTAGAFTLPVQAVGDGPPRTVALRPGDKGPEVAAPDKPAPPKGKAVKRRALILLWMSGGPSQFETFDLKPGAATGGPFKAIPTVSKGVQISEHLPKLAKLTNHMAIIRSVTHREGDHGRGSYLMRTGYAHDGAINYPNVGSVLGKYLGEGRPDLPRYVRLGGGPFLPGTADGAGFLGPLYGPLMVKGGVPGFKGERVDGPLALPPVEAFTALAKGRGEQMRKAVAKAFDLGQEKDAVRDAYGRDQFGQGCLLARRLVEAGVPVVEVVMGGWDTHANSFPALKKLSARLDAGWSSLLKDLQERKMLDEVLVVWMGEFGRTPQINASDGRDHWPLSFSAVLAGRGIKGGQVIGATNADGTKVAANPVKPPELLATIYTALGVDPTQQNPSNTGRPVRLVETGAKAIRAALR
jgi:RNA polymerase sigma factor (sigma-70 family)